MKKRQDLMESIKDSIKGMSKNKKIAVGVMIVVFVAVVCAYTIG